MRVSRRNVLIAAGAGAAAAGFVGLRFAFSKPENVIADVLYSRLGYLKLEPAGVQAFAHDLVVKNWVATSKLRAFNATGLMRMPFESFGIHADALLHGQERIVTYYLLSSDFFLTGADMARMVNYLGFYDPFKAACANPFPRTVPDEAA